jgi:hypothetical protein
MICPRCVDYGMNGLVPVLVPRTEEELALPPERRPPRQVIWTPCVNCIGGIASCCDAAGSEGRE